MNMNDRSTLQTILTLLDVLSSHKSEGQSWIHLLSLLCIFTILNQPTASASASSDPPANPLQKLLGDLTKGAGSGASGGDTLLSLLPLLNSPQLKSKLNPSSIAAMMNIVQNLTGTQAVSPAKSSPPPAVTDTQSIPTPPAPSSSSPQPEPTPPPAPTPPASMSPSKSEIPAGGRFLDWKSSF